ncbi:hypothetical protein FRC04_009479 [Tulasnella sp. 424]|nr:hypothetical protein FRC04_009479 [Tulasnella sp. 424]KAG8971200.1 hypothetical protein FRC05_011394 [Tulasnella sp. 425]
MSPSRTLALNANSVHVPKGCVVHVHSTSVPQTASNLPTIAVTSPTTTGTSLGTLVPPNTPARKPLSQPRPPPEHVRLAKDGSKAPSSLSGGSVSSVSGANLSPSEVSSRTSSSSDSSRSRGSDRRTHIPEGGAPGHRVPKQPRVVVVQNQTARATTTSSPIQTPQRYVPPKHVHFSPSLGNTASTSTIPNPPGQSSRRAVPLRSPSFPMPPTPPLRSSKNLPVVSPPMRGGVLGSPTSTSTSTSTSSCTSCMSSCTSSCTSCCTSATSSTSPSHIGLQLSGMMSQNISTTTLVESSPVMVRKVSKERISTTFTVSPNPVPTPLPAQQQAPLHAPRYHPISSTQSSATRVCMPVPITMPVPEPSGPPVSVPPAPSSRRLVTTAVPAPIPTFTMVQTVPQVIPGKTPAPSTTRPVSRVPTPVTNREGTDVRRPSTESDRTVVAQTQEEKRKYDAPNALPDLPASRKKGESYWEARGQHLYEDTAERPRLDMTVGDGMNPLKEEYLNEPATVPWLKVVNLIIPDRISGAWTIKVTSAKPGHIVSIGDVLSALSKNLHIPVYDHEPQWLSLSGKQQTAIARTLHKNRALAGAQVGGNLRRLDFLEGRNVFVGLSRDYGKCGLPMWRKFVPGLKPFGEEMWNFWVVELEELGPSPPRYLGDR